MTTKVVVEPAHHKVRVVTEERKPDGPWFVASVQELPMGEKFETYIWDTKRLIIEEK